MIKFQDLVKCYDIVRWCLEMLAKRTHCNMLQHFTGLSMLICPNPLARSKLGRQRHF